MRTGARSCVIRLEAGEHDRCKCPVAIDLPWEYQVRRGLRLVEAKTGREVANQTFRRPKGLGAVFLLDGLKAHGSREYVAELVEAEAAAPAVTVDDVPAANRVDIAISGKPFTSYHYGREWVRPFLHPVVGPYSRRVTRSWPVTDDVPGEEQDHVHHKSLWVAYGDCSGVDNWSEEEEHGWQIHRSFTNMVSGPVFGQFTEKVDWCTAHDRKQFEEARTLRFFALPAGERLFDLQVTFRMTEKPITFRDTKEGGLVSVRVATSMDVRNGGRIENGYGGVNERETWGKKAPWCDYSGIVDGKRVGIALFDHERNPRYPTEWHVRDYGLMTANCFAWKHYRPEMKTKGDMTFNKGSVTTWRYRVYVHKGDAKAGAVAERFLDYVAPPEVRVECNRM